MINYNQNEIVEILHDKTRKDSFNTKINKCLENLNEKYKEQNQMKKKIEIFKNEFDVMKKELDRLRERAHSLLQAYNGLKDKLEDDGKIKLKTQVSIECSNSIVKSRLITQEELGKSEKNLKQQSSSELIGSSTQLDLVILDSNDETYSKASTKCSNESESMKQLDRFLSGDTNYLSSDLNKFNDKISIVSTDIIVESIENLTNILSSNTTSSSAATNSFYDKKYVVTPDDD
jgi:hypothetical protein